MMCNESPNFPANIWKLFESSFLFNNSVIVETLTQSLHVLSSHEYEILFYTASLESGEYASISYLFGTDLSDRYVVIEII